MVPILWSLGVITNQPRPVVGHLVISLMVSLPLAAIAVAFVHKPRLLTPVTPGRGVVAPGNRPPIARSPPIRAVVNDTLTVGDALLGALNRQMDQLPDSEHLRRAERTLDALVDSGSAELEALKHGLDRDLHRAGRNTSLKLEAGLRRTGAIYETAFSHAEAALDAALVPTRDAVRADLQLHREEEAARREAAARRAANGRANGFARASTWRSLAHAPDRPKHAVVWVCEACSFVLSLMLLFAVADLVSAQHRVASPPRVARVHMRAPQRTFEYDEPDGLPLQGPPAADMSSTYTSLVGPLFAQPPKSTACVGRTSVRVWPARALGTSPEVLGCDQRISTSMP